MKDQQHRLQLSLSPVSQQPAMQEKVMLFLITVFAIKKSLTTAFCVLSLFIPKQESGSNNIVLMKRYKLWNFRSKYSKNVHRNKAKHSNIRTQFFVNVVRTKNNVKT